MPTRVRRARRRCSGTCSAVTRLPSGWSRSGASSPAGSPSSPRRCRSRSRSAEPGASPSVIAASTAGAGSAASGRGTSTDTSLTGGSFTRDELLGRRLLLGGGRGRLLQSQTLRDGDVVQLGRVQPEDLLLGGDGQPRVVGERV